MHGSVEWEATKGHFVTLRQRKDGGHSGAENGQLKLYIRAVAMGFGDVGYAYNYHLTLITMRPPKLF